MVQNQTLLVPVAVQPSSTEMVVDKKDRTQAIIRLHYEINENLIAVLKHTRLCFGKILQIGELLIEQKNDLKHGEFGRWLQKNLPFSQRTANRYMEIYRRRFELKLDNVTNLSQAYKSLKMLTHQPQPALEGESKTRNKIIISPGPDEIHFIMEALNKVKAILETNSMTRAIYFLAADWLEQNYDETELPPIEEKIHLLEILYNVKLVIQPNSGKEN